MKSSLQRGLSILGLFSEDKLEWSAEEIAQALKISRPTVYRYLKTLTEFGLLSSHSPNTFSCGPMVVELDYMLQMSDSLILAGAASVDQLASRFSGTAMLLRWYQNKILCIYAKGRQPAQNTSYLRGRPMHLGRGAISHAIMASLPRRQAIPLIQQYYNDLHEVGLGDSVEAIYTQLKALRRRGNGVLGATEEVTPGVIGTAAALLAGPNRPIGAVCLTINANNTSPAELALIHNEIRQAATTINETLATATP